MIHEYELIRRTAAIDRVYVYHMYLLLNEIDDEQLIFALDVYEYMTTP